MQKFFFFFVFIISKCLHIIIQVVHKFLYVNMYISILIVAEWGLGLGLGYSLCSVFIFEQNKVVLNKN
jgi:hypothetical protein